MLEYNSYLKARGTVRGHSPADLLHTALGAMSKRMLNSKKKCVECGHMHPQRDMQIEGKLAVCNYCLDIFSEEYQIDEYLPSACTVFEKKNVMLASKQTNRYVRELCLRDMLESYV